jgi:mycothiol synthase
MTIDLSELPEPPRWPCNVRVRALTDQDDLRPVWDARTTVFLDHSGEAQPEFDEWLHEYTGGGGLDLSLWFLAEDAEGIAGLILCMPELAEDPGTGYISELGVRRDHRGEGLGLALLRHVFAEFHRRGKRRAALHVDTDNLTGAVRLYTRAGMQAEPRFVVWERPMS